MTEAPLPRETLVKILNNLARGTLLWRSPNDSYILDWEGLLSPVRKALRACGVDASSHEESYHYSDSDAAEEVRTGVDTLKRLADGGRIHYPSRVLEALLPAVWLIVDTPRFVDEARAASAVVPVDELSDLYSEGRQALG